jgi:hypothetical protein
MAHGVEGEEVVLADPVGVAQVFQASFEDAGLGVLLLVRIETKVGAKSEGGRGK